MVKFNRRKFVVNKSFQYSLVARFVLMSVSLISVFYFANWYFFESLAQQAAAIDLPSGHVFFHFVDEQKRIMNSIFLIAGTVSILIITFFGILISHKVAGPLYRLTKHLNAHSLKDVKPVTFRDGDYFIEVGDAFNEFIKR